MGGKRLTLSFSSSSRVVLLLMASTMRMLMCCYCTRIDKVEVCFRNSADYVIVHPVKVDASELKAVERVGLSIESQDDENRLVSASWMLKLHAGGIEHAMLYFPPPAYHQTSYEWKITDDGLFEMVEGSFTLVSPWFNVHYQPSYLLIYTRFQQQYIHGDVIQVKEYTSELRAEGSCLIHDLKNGFLMKELLHGYLLQMMWKRGASRYKFLNPHNALKNALSHAGPAYWVVTEKGLYIWHPASTPQTALPWTHNAKPHDSWVDYSVH